MVKDTPETTDERCDCGGILIFDDGAGTAYCPSCKSIEKYIPPRNKTTDHLGRTDKDFAIEHAGYLADTVERVLQADRSILDYDDWLDLNTRVYEFRKRAMRAKT